MKVKGARAQRLKQILLLVAVLSETGCSLLIGNIKPVEEKSRSYHVLDLSREGGEWDKLENKDAKQDPKATDTSDLAYQSKKNASIISLNSACRSSLEARDQDLKGFTDVLLLGISDITLREEKQITLQNAPALETTVRGQLGGEPIMLRTVVLRRRDCLYDLMYVSRPDRFSEKEAEFSRFVASLKLNE